MMTCQEAFKQLQEYLDGESTGISKERLEEHLKACKKCCEVRDFQSKFKNLFKKRLSSEKTPENLRSQIVNMIKTLEVKNGNGQAKAP